MIITATHIGEIYNQEVQNTVVDCRETLEQLKGEKAFLSTYKDKREFQPKIDSVNEVLQKVRSKYVESKKFAFIIQTFMELVFHKMVHDGFIFKVYLVGSFKIVKTVPKLREVSGFLVGRVNHYETRKLKEYLLSEGRELYSKENPKGEKYIVYHTEETPFVKWSRPTNIKDIHHYMFRIITSENGPVRKLMTAVKNNPALMSKYPEK